LQNVFKLVTRVHGAYVMNNIYWY